MNVDDDPLQVRNALDLLELPYTFTQLPLLSAANFARRARERDVTIAEPQLAGLHRLGLLVPFFRVKRPTREIRHALRKRGRGGRHRARQLANWEPLRRDDLLEARDERALYDPAGERPRSATHLLHEIDGYRFSSSAYLYSQHQLACLWPVRRLLPRVQWRRRGESLTPQLKLDADARSDWVACALRLRQAAIAITALEPIYYSRIVGTLRANFDVDEFLRWRAELQPRWLLDWLGVDGLWIRKRAAEILDHGQRLDQLGGWSEVIGAGSPKRWDSLRGTARLVMDMRLAGEILLLCHDRLVTEGLAEPVPSPPRTRTPYDLTLRGACRPLLGGATPRGKRP